MGDEPYFANPVVTSRQASPVETDVKKTSREFGKPQLSVKTMQLVAITNRQAPNVTVPQMQRFGAGDRSGKPRGCLL